MIKLMITGFGHFLNQIEYITQGDKSTIYSIILTF